MSIDVLRAELQQIIESSGYDKLLRMQESVLEKEHIPDPNSEDWWGELPQHVKESLERALK